jgi:uncharacterized membrane protein
MTDRAQPTGWNSRLAWSGYVLGLSLGGFFDGIMLHQVLQWHHLLSLVPGESLRRIETQILADGAFHVLMYVVALAGLWLLWGARRSFAGPEAGRRLLAAALIGFGVWNVIDVVVFHWLLHIHRIRVDVPAGDRLRWDLLWLALFALPPLAAAWLVERRGRGGRGPAAPVSVGLLVIAAAGLSTRAPEGSARTILFRPGIEATEAFSAIAEVDGRIVWSSADGRLLSVQLPPGSGGWGLYGRGALVVGGPGSPAACLSWSKGERSSL